MAAGGKSIVNINGEGGAEREALVDCRCTSVGQDKVVSDEEVVTIKKKFKFGEVRNALYKN